MVDWFKFGFEDVCSDDKAVFGNKQVGLDIGWSTINISSSSENKVNILNYCQNITFTII